MVPEQRPLSYCFPYFGGRDLRFIPFEDQYSIRLENAHTLLEPGMEHFRPIIIKLAILFCKPCILSDLAKVGGIKHYKGKRIIFKRKIRKIASNIGSDNAMPLGLTVSRFPNILQFFSSFVRINCGRVIFVEPYCSRSTSYIEYLFIQFLHHPFRPSSPRSWGSS